MYVALGKLPGLTALLQAHSTPAISENFTKELESAGRDFEKFCQLVESTLDLDQVRHGQFLIKADFDENLGELRAELDSLETRMQRTVNNLNFFSVSSIFMFEKLTVCGHPPHMLVSI